MLPAKAIMLFGILVAAIVACFAPGNSAQAQVLQAQVLQIQVLQAQVPLAQVRHVQFRPWQKLPDLRSEFVHLCVPHMVGRWAHPEEVCGCLHDHAAAAVEDDDLREALLRGISETGVPSIETEWVPASKRSEIGATFTKIARPTLQCMFEPAN